MKAAAIMTKEVVTIDSLATVTQAAQLMQQKNVRVLIVERTKSEDAYGIVTETDIIQKVVAKAKNPQQVYVSQIMTKPCIVVNPNLAVEHLASLFVRANIRVAPVIQERLLGIVSLTDILKRSDYLKQAKMYSTLEKLEKLSINGSESTRQKDLATQSNAIYDAWCSG